MEKFLQYLKKEEPSLYSQYLDCTKITGEGDFVLQKDKLRSLFLLNRVTVTYNQKMTSIHNYIDQQLSGYSVSNDIDDYFLNQKEKLSQLSNMVEDLTYSKQEDLSSLFLVGAVYYIRHSNYKHCILDKNKGVQKKKLNKGGELLGK